MALAALPIITPLGPFPTLPVTATSLDFVFTAADATSNTFVATGRELVLVQNSDASPHTITFTSVVDGSNRAGNVTAYTVGAGLFCAFLFTTTQAGWRQSNGTTIIAASDTTVKFAVLRLPSIS